MPQTSRSHGCGRQIEHVIKRHAVGGERVDEFEIAYREPVERHESVRVDAPESRDMPEIRVMRYVEIMQHGSGGYHRIRHTVHTESLESFGAELRGEP